MSPLPSNIISDILMRLPVKSLLRFRCISKPFCSQIDSPDFTKLHLNHSNSHHHNTLILSRVPGCRLYSLDLHSLDQAHEIDHPLATQDCDCTCTVQVIGSCNGLLCLRNSLHLVLMLLNPSTRKHHILPPINPHNNVVYGFGYDSINDDYKLMSINLSPGDSVPYAYVYSMKSNLWTGMCDFPFQVFTCHQSHGLFLSGALHFIVARPQECDPCSNNTLIIAVDLATRTEGEYCYRALPPVPESLENWYGNLGVLNECLSVTCRSGGGLFDVWVMKDYGVAESWTKLFSIWHKKCHHFKPLATSISGNEVILQRDHNKLYSYHLEWERVKGLNIQRMPVPFSADVYVESLVNPDLHGTMGMGILEEMIYGYDWDDLLSDFVNLDLQEMQDLPCDLN